MKSEPRTRFWFEATAASMSGALLILTVFWRDWIELVFKVNPDRGSGVAEGSVVILSFLATALFTAAASRHLARLNS